MLAECLRHLLRRERLDLALQLAVIGKRAVVEEQAVQRAGQGRVVGAYDFELLQIVARASSAPETPSRLRRSISSRAAWATLAIFWG